MKKKIFALCLVIVMLVGLCACDGSSTPPMSPEETWAAVQENFEMLKSFTMKLDMSTAVEVDGTELSIAITLKDESMADPIRDHMNMTIDLGIMAFEVEIYSEVVDNKMITYTGMDIGSGMEWSSECQNYNPEEPNTIRSLVDSPGAIFGLTEGGTEYVNGVKATRYDAMISSEIIAKGLASMEGSIDRETFAALSELGDVPLVLWIDRDALMLVKAEMDFSELVEGMASGMVFTVSFSDFDAVEKFEIPAEIKNA